MRLILNVQFIKRFYSHAVIKRFSTPTILSLQEGVDKISVFDQVTRTNAAVEAYNGYIGKIIQTHPNLFALAKKLREEEFSKSREFELLFKSANPPEQRRYYRLRDEKIRKMSKLLKEDKISVDVFLNGIVFEDNKIFDDRCGFGCATSLNDSDDESESDETQTQNTNENGVISGSTCVVCYDKPADVLLSCGHYRYCIDCFNRSKETHQEKVNEFYLGSIDQEPKFQCPFCKQDITAHMHVPKIFH